MAVEATPAGSAGTGDGHATARPPRLHRRRMSAPAPRARPAPRRLPPCRPLPLSLEALDLSPAASPAQSLASLRFLVLSYLADLERRLALFDTDSALDCDWPKRALDMLRAIRADVSSHLPDLPDLPDLDLVKDVLSLKRPLSYVPTLSAKLRSLHGVLADEFPSLRFDFTLPSRPSFDFSRPSFDFDFTTPRELLDAFRVDVDAFLAELPSPSSLSLPSLSRASSAGVDDEPTDADAAKHARALLLSHNGTALLAYDDLPAAWQNNPFVVGGYRFIPLRRPHLLLLSLVRCHNESLNIYTHLVPLLLWGSAFVWPGLSAASLAAHTPLYLKASPYLAPVAAGARVVGAVFGWVAGRVPGWLTRDVGRYTLFADPASPRLPLPLDESLFVLFALACLASSTLWHTMAGCAHRRGMETCARVDYVGIGWLIATSIATVVHHGYACAEAAVEATPLGHRVLHPGEALSSLVEAGAGLVHDAVALVDEMPMPAALSSLVGEMHRMHPLERLQELLVDAHPHPAPVVQTASLSSALAVLAAPLQRLRALPSSVAHWPAYHPVGAACLVLCAAAGVSGNVLPFCAWFNQVEYRLWRTAFFVGISFSALAPLAGIAALQGWGRMVAFVAPLCPSLAFYVAGLFFYAAQIPERWIGGGPQAERSWVGRVTDMCGGGSHAIWHVFIVLAIRAHRDGLREMRVAAAEGGCAVGGA
ncbi:hemolysin-III related-domain-containing protein [Mycena alexandri]|uniref:Hemolysin-III related-domain-containing protein n=1 Tax=Mycena alexandri TaxID=1745969 RepID=A0AAD6XB52_9AGAR|nr:hemolysin-III related-domain-containing protein [Mycena alexandri]